jgi:hypothetical protein
VVGLDLKSMVGKIAVDFKTMRFVVPVRRFEDIKIILSNFV